MERFSPTLQDRQVGHYSFKTQVLEFLFRIKIVQKQNEGSIPPVTDKHIIDEVNVSE